jgi:DNA-binding response OmpR family regulator
VRVKKRVDDMSAPALLVLDDDRSFVEAVALFLEDHGYHTVAAYSCQEGLARAEDTDIRLAIIDVNLPDGNGVDVAKEIGGGDLPIPVILISSNHDIDLRTRPGAAGARAFLPKPLAPDDLLAAISAALGNGRHHNA